MRFKKPKPLPGKKPTAIRLPFAAEKPAEGTTVLLAEMPGPVIRGQEKHAPDICCGKCGHVLILGMSRKRISDIVIRCFACQSYNYLGDPSPN